MKTTKQRQIPTGRKVAYSLPAFALALVGIPVYVHIPKFYTDVVGVSIVWVGGILLFIRLFDAFTDPLLGIVSDRTRSPMGRRRPYILGGSLLLSAAILLLFIPPELGAEASTAWFAVTVFALFFFWTVTAVPYEALGPELTTDYSERTSLFALRDGLLIAGTLMAAAAPVIIDSILASATFVERERSKFFWMAALYIPLLTGTCIWCVYRIREKGTFAGASALPRLRDLKGIMRNRPFMILMISYAIGALGSNLPATLILYYVEYVLESTHANLFLLMYFFSGIAMLPLWIKLARHIGKKWAWLASMALNTCAFMGVFFLGAGDEWQYAVLVVVSGFGFGATLALPSAIQADVIDYDELLTGKRQEGWYIGIWSVVKKLSAAVGVGAGLTIMGAVGYTPGKEQPEEVIWTLRVMYALVPCLCNVIAFGVALYFPISKSVYEEIQDGIANRKSGAPVVDPLKPSSR